MPQLCLLFYEILQSWRSKGGGGAWHNGVDENFQHLFVIIKITVSMKTS